MSAFIVSKAHIDAIVLTALYGSREEQLRRDWYAPTFGNPGWKVEVGTLNRLGQMLWDECTTSVNYRYAHHNHPEPFEVYQFDDFTANRIPAVTALKLIQCYEYQSCEHDGWKDSYAKRFCEQLTSSLIGCLPGYDAAPWGIDSLAEVTR